MLVVIKAILYEVAVAVCLSCFVVVLSSSCFQCFVAVCWKDIWPVIIALHEDIVA